MRHPEAKDICDVGQILFRNNAAAKWVTAVILIVNNIFVSVCIEKARTKSDVCLRTFP